MNNLWTVLRFEFARQGRRRGYLFTTFGIPLIAVALLLGYQVIQGLTAGDEESLPDDPAADFESGPVGYVDQSGLFTDLGLFVIGGQLIRYDSQDEALAALETGEIKAVYVIAADYLETGAVTKYVDRISLAGFAADGFFTAFLLQTLTGDLDRDLYHRLQNPANITEHRVEASGTVDTAQSEGSAFVLVYVFAFTLMAGTFFTSGYLMRSVLEEKENRMVEILLSTMRPVPLLAGKVLAMGALGLIQVMVWLAAAVYLLQRLGNVIAALGDISVAPMTLLWAVIYFVLGYLFFAGLYAAVSAVSPSMREGPQIAAFITIPAALPFYFIALFTETPKGPIPTVLSLIPITAPLSMVQRLVLTQVPLTELMISVGLLALAAAGAIWLAGRLFRINTLLAGQMPGWRDMVRLVREA